MRETRIQKEVGEDAMMEKVLLRVSIDAVVVVV
jgi:hypothetical protein